MRKIRRFTKKCLVWLVAVVMLVTFAPAAVFAAADSSDAGQTQKEQIQEVLDGETVSAAKEVTVPETGADAPDKNIASDKGEKAVPEKAAGEKAAPEEADPEPVIPALGEQVGQEAKNAVSAGQLVLGTDVYVDLDDSDDSVYYSFTPEESGEYKVFSHDYSGDPYVNYYGEDSNCESSEGYDDDGGESWNFSFTASLEKGKTYYYQFAGYGTYYAKILLVKTVTVTFDAILEEGGYFEKTWDDEQGDYVPTASKEYTLEVGSFFDEDSYSVSNDDPMKTFVGWYDAKTGGNKLTDETIISDSLTAVYAHWKTIQVVDLTIGTQATVTQEGVLNYYRLTVPEDGCYRITFAGPEDDWVRISIYDENLSGMGSSSSSNGTAKYSMEDAEKDEVLYFQFDDDSDNPVNGTALVEKISMTNVTFHVNNDHGYYNRYDPVSGTDKEVKEDTQRYEEGEVICDGNGNYENPPYADETVSFLGWARTANASKPETITVGTEALDVYGVWANWYTVKFMNGEEEVRTNSYLEGKTLDFETIPTVYNSDPLMAFAG